SQIVADIKLGKTGKAYLINEEGYFIISPPFGGRPLKDKAYIPDGGHPGKSGIVERLNYCGKRVLCVYRKVPRLGWWLLVEQDTEEIFSPLYSLRNKMFLIALISVFIAVVVSLAVSDLLIKALKHRDEKLEEKQRQITQSEKLAALGQVAAGVAHEIRNPLASIKVGIHSIQKEIGEKLDLNDEIREDIEIIKKDIDRIASIIARFLSFARPAEPNYEPINVNSILTQTISLVRTKMKEQGIQLKLSLSEDLPPLMGDREQLKQVFLNIILNAIQAMPNGGKIEISTGLGDGIVQVKISDTGCGIPKDLKERIFDPFFTTKDDGTGLGLSIAQGIVERHRGKIEVVSEEGKGSTFIVSLPLKEVKAR
ncbi:MAG: hypothetical protein DRP95_05540, partial [Candidatus Latescibacterota bacterium]